MKTLASLPSSAGFLSIFIPTLPEIANFSTKCFILSKIYTDEGGIKSLKLVAYLLVHADRPGITITFLYAFVF